LNHFKLLIALAFAMLSFWEVSAQTSRNSFHVYDELTRQPIPFVHVKIQGSGSRGTTTDVLGAFTLESVGNDAVLVFSHISYLTKEISLAQLQKNPNIFLVPDTQELSTFEFSAGENPALRIVRKAIQNRDINNPDKLDSYRYASYNKVVMTLEGLEENPDVDDTTFSFLRGGHLFMTESHSEVKFKRPGKRNETVKASKVSGIDNPMFAAVSTTFQPFSVYTDHIKILEIPYVNPISDDGMRKYDYFLEDSLLTEAGTTYLISYQPKPGKTYHLGKGLVYISSKQYALENFLLKPADDSGQILFEIQQKNQFDGQHWFPQQLNSIYVFTELDLEGRKGKLVNQTFLSDIGINDLDPGQKISMVGVTYDIAETVDWSTLRVDSLSAREYLTYERFDQLDEKTKKLLNNGANILAYLSTGRIKLGAVDLIPKRILRLNEYERFGLGLGLSSNETLSDFFRIEGYFRYGTRDRAWKYGGNLSFYLNPDQDARMILSYSQDIDETGRPFLGNWRTFSLAGHYFRNFLANRMDQVERFSAEYTQMPLSGFRYRLIGSVENRFQPLNFAESAPADDYLQTFTAAEAGVELNYSGGQSTTRVGNDLISLTLSYPVMGIRVSRAVPGVFGANQDFWNTEFRLQHQWSSGNSLNQLHLSAHGIWGTNLPISYLNTGFGVRAQQTSRFDLPLSFAGFLQTMQIYEFLSNRALHLSYAHLTGPLFTKKGKGIEVAPQLKFHQNFAIGSLDNPERYRFVPFQTMERGFWESGMELTNLIKLTSGFQLQGWGVGVFYRYGPYAFPNSRDNLRLTLSITAGF
jgi:hypothetical protein